MRKISVSLDDEAYDVAVAAAEAAGVSLSAWLSHAALREARVAAGLRAVAEWEAEHGVITDAEMAWADEVLRPSRRASEAG